MLPHQNLPAHLSIIQEASQTVGRRGRRQKVAFPRGNCCASWAHQTFCGDARDTSLCARNQISGRLSGERSAGSGQRVHRWQTALAATPWGLFLETRGGSGLDYSLERREGMLSLGSREDLAIE